MHPENTWVSGSVATHMRPMQRHISGVIMAVSYSSSLMLHFTTLPRNCRKMFLTFRVPAANSSSPAPSHRKFSPKVSMMRRARAGPTPFTVPEARYFSMAAVVAGRARSKVSALN